MPLARFRFETMFAPQCRAFWVRKNRNLAVLALTVDDGTLEFLSVAAQQMQPH
jgi:hypothetical protein